MTKKIVISAFAASLLLGGASFAHAQQSNTAATFGVGTAEANRQGAQAGAISAGKASYATPQQQNKKNKKRRGDDKSSSGGQMSGEVALPNSATTFGTGAIYTDRNRASGAASTGATATGSGTQAATSDAYVYGSTTKQGSEAEAQGTSTAVSQERQRRPRPN